MSAAGESRRSPGPPQAFWPVLVRLNFKSRRQRSERQSAERFYAAAFRRSYQLKAPSVDIRARAADPPSPRRRCAPRRSNSKSTRPRSLCPWWRAGPRSCAERRNAGAVMRGRARVRVRRLVASSLKLALRAPSDPAGLRRRPASAGAEPLSRRSLAAVVRFPAAYEHARRIARCSASNCPEAQPAPCDVIGPVGLKPPKKIVRVGLGYVRTKPQTTPEQQKAGRIEQNQQHTPHTGKMPSLRADSSSAMSSALPTHRLDRAVRRAPTSSY